MNRTTLNVLPAAFEPDQQSHGEALRAHCRLGPSIWCAGKQLKGAALFGREA